jgi:Undecaprenyl-phosphate galactose phosphotransferase WbaP
MKRGSNEVKSNLSDRSAGGTVVIGVAAGHDSAFHSPVRPTNFPAESEFDADSNAVDRPIQTRDVGLGYSVRVLLNSLPLLLVDIIALTATIVICRLLFHRFGISVGVDVSRSWIAIMAGFVIINIEQGLYPGVRLSPVEEFRRLIVSVSCVLLIWGFGVALLTGGVLTQLRFLLVVWLACVVTLPISRGWARNILGRWTRWGIRTLVCGDDPTTLRLYHWLKSNPHLGLRPVGVIADRDDLGAASVSINEQEGWVGSWADTHRVAVERGVYHAVVVPPENRPAAISSLLADHLHTIPHVFVLSELAQTPEHWNPQQFDGLTGIHLQQNLMLPLPRLTKRCMDLVVGMLGSIVLLPLLFYVAVAVKMSSRGPILYGHDRLGKDGRHFKAWKFRSMFENSSDVLEYYLEQHPELRTEWECDHKLRHDPRVTRIGRFIRKTSIDELPQLWNVIRGDMSLVGPRPIVTGEIPKYGEYYSLYTMVTPGITGLWQVSGRNNTTYEERVQFDAYYVRNWSPWMDLYLLTRTIRIVLFAKGAY